MPDPRKLEMLQAVLEEQEAKAEAARQAVALHEHNVECIRARIADEEGRTVEDVASV